MNGVFAFGVCTETTPGNYICDGDAVVSDNLNTDMLFMVNDGTVTLSGDVIGAGNFTKDGAGTLYMTGVFNNDGFVTVDGGILQGDTSSFTKNIFNNSKVVFAQETDGIFLPSVYGTGDVDKTGAGTLILAGQQYFTGEFNILEGALQVTTVTLDRDVNAATGAYIIFDQRDGDGEYSNAISGGGAVIKQGLDAVKLGGVNTYTGGTYIKDAAGLIIENDFSLGDVSSKVFIEGGRLTVEGNTVSDRDFVFSAAGQMPNYINVTDGAQYQIDGIISGTSFVKTGLGTLILGGANTHTDGTQVSEGVLGITNAGALSEGFLAVTNEGAFAALDSMTIENDIYMAENGALDIGAGNTVIVNGVLAGETLNKKGSGALFLTAKNHYENGINIFEGKISGGTDSLVGNIDMSAGASVDFTQDFDGVHTGAINGGVINKYGAGVLETYGVINSDELNINEGLFWNLNEITADIDVAAGAVFMFDAKGNGSLNNGGTVFLQSGDRAFNGGVTMSANSNLIMEASETGAAKLIVTGGDVTLADTSTITFVTDGPFVTPIKYEIIDYDGALCGQFGKVEIADGKRVVAELDYDEVGGVYVLFSRMSTDFGGVSGLKRNQTNVAAAMTLASEVPHADFDVVLNSLEALPSDVHRAAAFTQLGGFLYANMPMISSFGLFKENAFLRLENMLPSDSLSRNIWAQAAGSYHVLDGNDYAEKLYAVNAGGVFGLDKYFSDNFKAGLAGSYSRQGLDHNDKESLEGDEYQAGAYAMFGNGALELKAALSGGYRDAVVRREIDFLSRRARARTESLGVNLGFEGSFIIAEAAGLEIRPFIGGAGTYESRHSFREQDAGGAELSFDGDNVFYGDVYGGLGVQKKGAVLSYYLDLRVKQVVLSPDITLSMHSQEFTLKPVDRGVSFGGRLGAVKRINDYLSVYADMGADAGSGFQNYNANIGFRSFW